MTSFTKIIAIGAVLLSTPALSETYECSMRAVSNGKQNAPVTGTAQFDFSGGSVAIQDDFLRAVGKRGVQGDFDRQVGNDLLFSWSVNGVPLNLMPTEVTWYRQSVTYRARLDMSTNTVRVRADYVPRYGGGNTGTDIRGQGTCRKL